ncbi:MAG TPA: DUF899 family protein, partial [Acidimicrobiia bacterium]|nr:DUF899 family protein [Acidimicrobiia bacterium]
GDELAAQRRSLPWVPVEDYVLEGEAGPVRLSELFGGRSQLLVQHFMFAPSWDAGCPSCSAIADGWNGVRVHLEHHDVAMVAISRAPIEKLLAYRRRLGWSIPWVSSFGTSFNVEIGVSFTERQLAEGAEYNFRPVEVDVDQLPHRGDSDDPVDDWECPGTSAFALEDGQVFHTYAAFGRGVDATWAMYRWLDRAPLGRNEQGMWWRRNDEYEG